MTTYTWTDNAMQGGGACDVDKVNDNLMHLKYDNVSPQDGKVPYSAVSGKVDANGYANFIIKIDNSSVKIEAGSSNPNLVIAYPDGSLETISADYTISSISSDGTYTVIKEKGQNPLITTKTITEDIKAPTSPVDGDYWLNIGIKPMAPYKRVGGAWIATQYTKLGEFTRTSGTIGTPKSYAFNGQSVIEQALANNYLTNISFNHNIGSDCICKSELICISAELGYAIGDKALPLGKEGGGNFDTDGIAYMLNKLSGLTHSTRSAGTLYPFAVVNTSTITAARATYSNWNIRFITKRSF
ncbi:MAG TPA: hypothetical protein P5556_01025 [Candidatus Gastranaerophilales bacterium]|nr:hypothetical protein [Candidatus Gastranaerophilales bacterium]